MENSRIEEKTVTAEKNETKPAAAAKAPARKRPPRKPAGRTMTDHELIAEVKKRGIVLAESGDRAQLATLTKPASGGGIVWFSEVDMNDKGNVSSDYPAWYFDVNIRELAEDIKSMERALEDGVYTGPKKREAIRNLEAKKSRYEKILEGKSRLSGVSKDKVAKSLGEFGEEIKRSLFSHDEMWSQSCDPHAEAERMVSPCIKVTDEIVGSYIRQHGRMNVVDGKISRNDASIIYKSMAKLLGEPTDIERLRPAR